MSTAEKNTQERKMECQCPARGQERLCGRQISLLINKLKLVYEKYIALAVALPPQSYSVTSRINRILTPWGRRLTFYMKCHQDNTNEWDTNEEGHQIIELPVTDEQNNYLFTTKVCSVCGVKIHP